MLRALNLQKTVGQSLVSLWPIERISLHQAQGQSNERGIIRAKYFAALPLFAQVQNANDSMLKQAHGLNQSEVLYKFYLQLNEDVLPRGLSRFKEAGGDFILREDGTIWLIVAVLEDFSKSGWLGVLACQQVTGCEYA